MSGVTASGSPNIFTHRENEKAYTQTLNHQVQKYTSLVRALRDQCKKAENNTFIAHTQALETEILELKAIYERELDNTRYQLDVITAERNELHLDASKYKALSEELQQKYNEEVANRKKLENALADAHRLLSEKDALHQELRITIAQHQNNEVDLTKERDALQSSLTNCQIQLDAECKARADAEASYQKASDQINFERELNEKECTELRNKVVASERVIAICDQKLEEHALLDETLANTMAKIRTSTEAEFKKFQQDSEAAYQASLAEVKRQLQRETESLAVSHDECIHLKAVIEEMNSKLAKLDSRCGSLEDQNRSLIHTLEVERQQAANTIRELEAKLREMAEKLHQKIRELNDAYNANIPVDFELESLKSILQAEEQRLALQLANPASELLQTARGELVSSRSYFTGPRSQPGSPRRPIAGIGVAPPLAPLSARPKTSTADVDQVVLPPISTGNYYHAATGETTSNLINKSPRYAQATPQTRVFYGTRRKSQNGI